MRLPHVLRWLEHKNLTALALQETKLQDHEFPGLEIQGAGYHAVFSGQKSYNGVALLSRKPAADVVTRIDGIDNEQKRVLAATIDGVRVINLYVVNGKEVGTKDYRLKLDWLAAAAHFIAGELRRYPYTLVMGDFNVAPEDEDIHDPKKWKDKILCSSAERHALGCMLECGLVDTFYLFEHSDEGRFSWWHYQEGDFAHNRGLRIDLILASRALAERCTASVIDGEPRGWTRPSDHAPALATFKELPPA